MIYKQDNRSSNYKLTEQQRKILIAIFYSKDETIHQNTFGRISKIIDDGEYNDKDSKLVRTLVDYYKIT